MDASISAPERASLRRALGLEHVSSYLGVLPGVIGLMAHADVLVAAGVVLIVATAFLISADKKRWLAWSIVTTAASTIAYLVLGYVLGFAGYDLPHVAEPTLYLPAYGVVFGALVAKLEQGLGNLAIIADSLTPGGL